VIEPFVPTRRLAVIVLLAAPVWLLAAPLGGRWQTAAGALVLAALGMLLVVDAAATADRRALQVERSLPRSVGVGDEVRGTYTIRSRWPARVRGALYDTLPDAVRRVGPGPILFAVRRRGEATLPVSVTGWDRGEWPLGPIAIRAQGPLGLVERTLRFGLPDRITVAPSLTNARRFRLLALQHRLRDVGVRALRRRGEGTSIAGLRDYMAGDDPRFIDWKATARRRRVITREFSVEQGQTVMLAVDAGRLMTQQDAAMSRFEHALSSALVLADVAVASGDQVGLLVFNDEVRAFVPPARGAKALQSVREALIPVRATMVEPDYATAFRTLDARQRRRSLVVLFTDVIDVRSSQALIAHTARSARRHLPLVVALRNEALVAAAAPSAEPTVAGVYAAAAAEELLSAREEALAQMRQAGVSVVDVRPQSMAAAVVNRYLELKGRGAI
jgi:uncharacterized protein (DUF58 family)